MLPSAPVNTITSIFELHFIGILFGCLHGLIRTESTKSVCNFFVVFGVCIVFFFISRFAPSLSLRVSKKNVNF